MSNLPPLAPAPEPGDPTFALLAAGRTVVDTRGPSSTLAIVSFSLAAAGLVTFGLLTAIGGIMGTCAFIRDRREGRRIGFAGWAMGLGIATVALWTIVIVAVLAAG